MRLRPSQRADPELLAQRLTAAMKIGALAWPGAIPVAIAFSILSTLSSCAGAAPQPSVGVRTRAISPVATAPVAGSACAGRRAQSGVGYSLRLRPRPRFTEDDYHHQVMVSRGARTLQVLSLGQDDVLQSGADLAGSSFGQLDVDCDGDDDLVLFPAGGELGDGSRYVLVWPFRAEEARFSLHPHFYSPAHEWVSSAGGGGAPVTIQLLRGVDPSTMESSDDRPILVRRGAELMDFVRNRTYVSFPDDEPFAAPLVDIDRDGHWDLVLAAGGADNSYYAFWLFDPARGRFAYNAALSQLANPVMEPATGEITEFHNRGAGGAEHRMARYRLQDGALQKTWESEQTSAVHARAAPSSQGLGLLRRVVRVHERGGTRVVCEAFVNPENDAVVALVVGDRISCSEDAIGGAP